MAKVECSELVCSECGGTNIQTKAWVNANTNEYIGDAGDGDSGDNWCEDCEEHTIFINDSEFNM